MYKKVVLVIFMFFSVTLFFVSFSNKVIQESSSKFIDVNNKFDVAVLLGTAKFMKNKQMNLFYSNRIQKVVDLYRSGKIKYIVVSGDNSRQGYDEPTTMKNDLIKNGIPSSIIYCDYAGFSTIDSMLRMKLIFREHRFVVISQRFHIERAIYIARRNGLEAYGFCAKDVPGGYAALNGFREKLARLKALLEVIIGKGPYFKGKTISIIKT